MNENEAPPEELEVFRGGLEECIEHLSRCISSNAEKHLDVVVARQPIAEFCKVTPNTVKSWLEGGSIVGQSRIRLMCFLDTLNYRVLELEKLGNVRPLTEILGYGLMPFEDVLAALKYTSMQHLLGALLGKDGMQESRQTEVWKIVKEKKLELSAKKEECRQKLQPQFSLAEAIQQRKASAISSLADALLMLLETPEIRVPFFKNLKNLSAAERKIFLQLSGSLNDVSIKLAQCQEKEEEID